MSVYLFCLSVTLVYCVQTALWIKLPLGMEVDLGPGHIVLGGDPAFPLEKRHIPHFLSRVYFGQTAGWIKMPLGTVVGLGQRHIVVDGDPAPPQKGHTRPATFGPCLMPPNGRPSQLLLNTCRK